MCQTCITEAKMAAGIPEIMKAVVAYAPKDYRLEQVPVPKIGPKEILVKIEPAASAPVMLKRSKGRQLLGR